MPKVTYATVSKVQSDRVGDAVEMARQAAKLIGRHGPESRLLSAEVAGEQVGTMVYTVEFDSIDSYAAQVEELDGDAELRELLVRTSSASSPVVTLSTSLSTEIPLGRTPKPGHGVLVEVHLSRINPGRFNGALDDMNTAISIVESRGAVNTQAFQMGFAGAQTGTVGIAFEWSSVRAQALSGKAWLEDPAGQRLGADLANGTGPITLVSSALYRDIPL